MPTPVPLELRAIDALTTLLVTAQIGNRDPNITPLALLKDSMSYGLHIGLQLAAHDPQLGEALRERVEQYAIRSGYTTDAQLTQAFDGIVALYRQIVRDLYTDTIAALS